jgi:hypothetical protein
MYLQLLTRDTASVSFGALRYVARDLYVANSRFRNPFVETETTMNVSFPKLNSSEPIFAIGRTSRYVPRLF